MEAAAWAPAGPAFRSAVLDPRETQCRILSQYLTILWSPLRLFPVYEERVRAPGCGGQIDGVVLSCPSSLRRRKSRP